MSDLPAVAAQMADTLRAVLVAVDQEKPYPWKGGALKQQIREDLTAYDLLGTDDEIRAELDKSPYLPKRPPTDEQMERARQIARDRGWLTDEGFIWERGDD